MYNKEDFYNKHYNRVFTTAYYKLNGNKQDAEDVTQDVFIRAFKAMDEGRFDGKNVKSWLNIILRNLIVDMSRSKFRHSNRLVSMRFGLYVEIEDKSGDAHFDIEKEESLSDLAQLLKRLPEQQLKILKRFVLDGVAYKDICKEEGLPVNTLLAQKRYAILKIRKLIKENNITFTY